MLLVITVELLAEPERCDNCRRRRVCCLRNENESCSLCRSRGLNCTFVSLPNPKTRGSSGASARSQCRKDLFVKTSSPPSRPWPTRTQQEECFLDTTSNVPETSQFIGLSGDQDPFILQYFQTKRVQSPDGVQWACQCFGDDPRFPASFAAVPDQHLDAYPSYYPTARIQEIASPHNDQLVKAFFEVVHPAVPILDPQSFAPSTVSPSLLAAIFSLAHPYCSDAQSINPWLFMDFDSQALPIEARNAKLETVEAALLYAQRHTYIFRAPTMPGMWAEVGSLVGMSQDVGLNIDASRWDIPEDQKKRRKRLWWAVYMQDKWTALTLGRSSYIHDDQFDVEELELTDIVPDQQVSEEMRGLSARVFVAGARLAVILSDILSELYTIKSVKRLHSLKYQECCDIASAFLARLERWKEENLTPLLEYHVMYDPTGKDEAISVHCHRPLLILPKATCSSHTTLFKSHYVVPFSALLLAVNFGNAQRLQFPTSLSC